MDTPSERFKEVREVFNFTQKEFADKLGLNQTYISAIEKGRRGISSKLLKKLFELFQVSSEWILNGNGQMITKSTTTKNETDLSFSGKSLGENRYFKKLKNERGFAGNDSKRNEEDFFRPGDRQISKGEAQLRLLRIEYDRLKGDINKEISPSLGSLLHLRLAGDKISEIAAVLHTMAENEMLSILKQVVESKISKEEGFKKLDQLNENLQVIAGDISIVENAMNNFAFNAFLHFEEMRPVIEGSLLDDGSIKHFDNLKQTHELDGLTANQIKASKAFNDDMMEQLKKTRQTESKTKK